MAMSWGHDWLAHSRTVEALAQSRELLAIPVWHLPGTRLPAALETGATRHPRTAGERDVGPSTRDAVLGERGPTAIGLPGGTSAGCLDHRPVLEPVGAGG